MRFALTAVILLSATTLVSGQVKTSDFLPRWQVVAAPYSPVSVVAPWEIGQHSAGRWNWPYYVPASGGNNHNGIIHSAGSAQALDATENLALNNALKAYATAIA